MIYVNGISKKQHSKLHKLLVKNYGNASKCEHCGETGRKRYEWALKKGAIYSDNPTDYIQLCVPCHRKYDFNEEIRKKLKERKKGELNNRAKLTQHQVDEIRLMIAKKICIKDISLIFNVSHTAIHNIKSGKRWNNKTENS